MKIAVAPSFSQSSAPLSAKTAPLPAPPSLFRAITGIGSRGKLAIAMARRDFSAAASPKREEAAATPISFPPSSSSSSPFKPSAAAAAPPAVTPWSPLAGLDAGELDLDFTLPTGQSFRWRRTSPGVYTGVVGKRVVQVSQRGEHLQLLSAAAGAPSSAAAAAAAAFRVLVDKEAAAGGPETPPAPDQQLADYFNARVILSPLALAWAAADPRWAAAARVVRGARVLRQPPLECLLSFVCSSNNSIGRITGMVEHLARRYGTLLASAEEAEELLGEDEQEEEEEDEQEGEELEAKKRGAGAPAAPAPATPAKPSAALSRSGARPAPRAAFYSFPTLEQLEGRVTEQELREAGFGYRAKYIVGTVEALASIAEERRRKGKGKSGGGKKSSSAGNGDGDGGDGGDDDDFLLSLRGADEEEALRELAKLPGVGPKVAACVALFSLDKHAVVPVDTHVWQLAGRHYLPSIRNKPFSPAAADLVSSALRERFGPFAGWAHNSLFIAELPGVRDRVAEAERLAKKKKEEKKKGGGGGGRRPRAGEEAGASSDDESGDDESGDDESKVGAPPPAKKRNTAAAKAAEAAATFNKIKKEEGGGAVPPRTPGGK